MKTVMVASTKGGTAKTTSVIALSATWATGHQQRIAMWDGDPQGTLTRQMRHAVIREPWSADPVPVGIPGMENDAMIFRGGRALGLTALPQIKQFFQRPDWEDRLDADIAIIDTPPGGLLHILAAADVANLLLVPVDTTPLGLEGPDRDDGPAEGHRVAAADPRPAHPDGRPPEHHRAHRPLPGRTPSGDAPGGRDPRGRPGPRVPQGPASGDARPARPRRGRLPAGGLAPPRRPRRTPEDGPRRQRGGARRRERRMSAQAPASRRSRGGGGLDWLASEGGGDAGTAIREQLQTLVGPPGEGESVQEIPCAHIDHSPYQARRVFPAPKMADLKESIRRNGLLQPIVVRPRPGGRYELIAGERRWRVVQLLGWESIAAVVRTVDDLTAHLLGQIENDAREDVSAWERALGYVHLFAHIEQDQGVAPSLAELGEMRGGVDKSTVSRYLTIGHAFPPEAAIRAGVTEEEMATLSLPSLLRAARKPEAQGFALLRDVLRKRRARAAERDRRPAAARARPVPDPRPDVTESGPAHADPDPPSGPESPVRWERYFSERGIRVETLVPAWELTPRQASAAAVRMIPALAALAARAGGVEVIGRGGGRHRLPVNAREIFFGRPGGHYRRLARFVTHELSVSNYNKRECERVTRQMIPTQPASHPVRALPQGFDCQPR